MTDGELHLVESGVNCGVQGCGSGTMRLQSAASALQQN